MQGPPLTFDQAPSDKQHRGIIMAIGITNADHQELGRAADTESIALISHDGARVAATREPGVGCR